MSEFYDVTQYLKFIWRCPKCDFAQLADLNPNHCDVSSLKIGSNGISETSLREFLSSELSEAYQDGYNDGQASRDD